MGKIIVGFFAGVACLGLLILFIFVNVTGKVMDTMDDVNQRLGITVEPVTVPVIVSTVQPYQPAPPRQPVVVSQPKPRATAVEREGWTDEIKEGLTSSGGRNK